MSIPQWAEGTDEGGPSADDLARVQAEVGPGERIAWVGKPSPTRGSQGRIVAAVGAMIFLVILGLRGLAGLDDPANGDTTWLFLGVLVALELACFIAVGLVITALVRTSIRRRRRITLYALTDRRAIIWRPAGRAGGVEVATFRRGDVHELRRVEYPDGSGDLLLYPTPEAGATTLFAGIPGIVAVERHARRSLLGPDR